jgi:Mitochondrial ribosomal subunit protein
VTVKRALTVAVSQLPLKDKHAIYKFRLLAGVRWTPTPPKDSGIKLGENAEHGYVKISCEDFPEPAMNLKWVSDRLDDLIREANVRFLCIISNRVLTAGCLRTTTTDLRTFLSTGDTWRPRRQRPKRGNSSRILQVASVAMSPLLLSKTSPKHGFPVPLTDLGCLLAPKPFTASRSIEVFILCIFDLFDGLCSPCFMNMTHAPGIKTRIGYLAVRPVHSHRNIFVLIQLRLYIVSIASFPPDGRITALAKG